MAENNTNSLIGLIGAVVFAICAIIVPFLKLAGFGFITETEGGVTSDMFWDEIATSGGIIDFNLPYDEYLDGLKLAADMGFGDEPFEIIWQIIPLWGLVFLGLGLLGAVLVAIPPLMNLGNMDPIEAPLAKIGLVAGLVATVVEEVLFIIAGLMEPNLEGGLENLGLLALVFLIVGWAALILGYYFQAKE